MERVKTLNPFRKQEFREQRSLLAYKILTILSWLLVVITSISYRYYAPNSDHSPGRTIWDQNKAHPTLFSLNPTMVEIYWIVLFFLQFCYTLHLFANDIDLVTAAATVSGRFILNNFLQTAFIMLWVRSRFWLAELLLAINLCNLKALYITSSTTPKSFIHIPVLAGPLAWTFIAILSNGAVMLPNTYPLAAKLLAHLVIWSVLFYAIWLLTFYMDYPMGFALSSLTAALAAQQFRIHVDDGVQCTLAVFITALLIVTTLSVLVPVGGLLGSLAPDFGLHGFSPDPECRQLLDDDNDDNEEQ